MLGEVEIHLEGSEVAVSVLVYCGEGRGEEVENFPLRLVGTERAQATSRFGHQQYGSGKMIPTPVTGEVTFQCRPSPDLPWSVRVEGVAPVFCCFVTCKGLVVAVVAVLVFTECPAIAIGARNLLPSDIAGGSENRVLTGLTGEVTFLS
jgi:hypothetical protein